MSQIPESHENILKRELYFLIYKFLEDSPLNESFNVLRDELMRKQLLPPQYEWTNGEERSQTLEETLQQNRHITADHLFKCLKRCHQALEELSPTPVRSLISFLSDGRFSLIRPLPKKSLIQSVDDNIPYYSNPYSLSSLSNHIRHAPVISSLCFTSASYPGHICNTLFSRQLSGPKPIAHLWSTRFYDQCQEYHRILGHLSSVFCVLFDRTGKYLITGADDALIKIWSATSGRLLASLRGHHGEITDLSVSMENDMLASGSCDKKIRVWNLRTTALITTLKGHHDHISGVKFCPLMTSNTRYLVSISQDGSVCFFKYDAITREFEDPPLRLEENKRKDSQLVSSSFSSGGAFFAVGSTDGHLYVYHISGPSGPTKILQIEQHTDHVDSLQFSNHSLLKFISGGRDGLAHIWNYEKQNWHNLRIDINERLADTPETNDETTKKGGIRVCMVAWTIDDRFVITSLTDNSIKVWFAHNAKLKHILYGHEDEVYIIEPHPIDGRIILTGGHDGAIVIWDVVTGTQIKTFYNGIEGHGSGSLFDAKWSPDGTMFAVTDCYGHVLFFGLSKQNPYEKLPEQMFFHTDYRPLVRDANDFVIDEQMQIAPHLMPPPFLVDIEGNPYPPNLQRLVPGREHCLDSQLIPYVDNYQVPSQDQGQRQTIDDLIEQLQRNVDLANNNNELNNNLLGNNFRPQPPQPPPRNASRDMGQRRNGDVEGVRNSANFVSADGGQMGVFMKKPLILPFSEHEIESIRQRQNILTQAEEEYYRQECKKRPTTQIIPAEGAGLKPKPFTRRQKRINQQRRGVRSSIPLNPSGVFINDLYESDDENDKDFTGISEEESSEEDEETSDSDWNQPSTSAAHVTSGQKRKRRGGSDGDQEDGLPRPAPFPISSDDSTVPESSRRKRRKINVEERENRRAERQKRIEQSRLERSENGFRHSIEPLDERFRPPDWFTNSKPKRSPYFPQIGDKVVYFRQGHQNYIDAIRRIKCYNINAATKPFKLRNSDADAIFAKIIGIQYQIKPPRLVTLKMLVIDPQAEKNEASEQIQSSSQNPQIVNHPQHFSVRYHDLDHVCDFIILKQLYDISISRDWHVNDIFRSVIDDKWWVGRIHSIRYTETKSRFQSIQVVWSNDETELLSPWDLEPIDSTISRPSTSSDNNNIDGVPVTDEERLAFSLIDESEWPTEVREHDRQRTLNGLLQIMQFSYAEEFAVPVDLNQHPIYAKVVPYPMDLSTIMARLENNFYRRIAAIKFDVQFIESNANIYNRPDSQIVKKAKIITECILRFIDNQQCVDPISIYNEVCANYQENLLNTSSGSLTSSNATESSFDRPRRSSRRVRVAEFSDSDTEHPPQAVRSSMRERRPPLRHRDEEPSPPAKPWKQLCRELIDFIFELQDSEPFRAPVDPILYPNYVHMVDTPMDLTTVKEQLLADVYNSPADFCKDMRLIFINSKTYNTNKKSRIYSMTVRLSALFEEKMRKVMSDWKSSKPSNRTRSYKRSSTNTQSTSRGYLRGRRTMRSPPMSPSSSYHDEQPHRGRPRKMLNHPTSDLNQPSSSGLLNSHRSSHKTLHYKPTSSTMEKYGLRHRTKRIRTYKEDSDDEDIESMDENPSNSNLSSSHQHLRRISSSDEYDEEEEVEESEKTLTKENLNDDTDKTEEDERTDLDNDDQEDEEDDDGSESDEEDEEKVDDDEDEEEEEEEEEDGQLNDSDATQVDEENKENSTRSRPVRAAARKRVNYDENDTDASEQGAIRERNVNLNIHQRLRRNSFASINESSRESMSSSNSSGGRHGADTDDSTRPSLRRSQRKIRPKRRFSSEDSDQDRHHHSNYHRRPHHSRGTRTYHTHYDNSDLYSAVKTRHRSGSTSAGSNNTVAQLRGSSSRQIQRINYNEDEIDHQIYSSTHPPNYSTRRSSVFPTGRSALIS